MAVHSQSELILMTLTGSSKAALFNIEGLLVANDPLQSLKASLTHAAMCHMDCSLYVLLTASSLKPSSVKPVYESIWCFFIASDYTKPEFTKNTREAEQENIIPL